MFPEADNQIDPLPMESGPGFPPMTFSDAVSIRNRSNSIVNMLLDAGESETNLSNDDVYTMVINYRVNVLAAGKEDKILRSIIAELWIRRTYPYRVRWLTTDIPVDLRRYTESQSTSLADLQDFAALLDRMRDHVNACPAQNTWVFPSWHSFSMNADLPPVPAVPLPAAAIMQRQSTDGILSSSVKKRTSVADSPVPTDIATREDSSAEFVRILQEQGEQERQRDERMMPVLDYILKWIEHHPIAADPKQYFPPGLNRSVTESQPFLPSPAYRDTRRQPVYGQMLAQPARGGQASDSRHSGQTDDRAFENASKRPQHPDDGTSPGSPEPRRWKRPKNSN